MWHWSHSSSSRVSMVFGEDLAPIWQQGICKNHDDIDISVHVRCVPMESTDVLMPPITTMTPINWHSADLAWSRSVEFCKVLNILIISNILTRVWKRDMLLAQGLLMVGNLSTQPFLSALGWQSGTIPNIDLIAGLILGLHPRGLHFSFLAGCPKSHFLGWYRNFLVYWYFILDNQVVNSTCPKDKLGWIWRAGNP